ncbi:Nif3-like dinuclear metal center hexameric protein [Candidatus Xianfuyuplasma coldseepsis]|uniref:GTP cyclohydrolase 1 type 2 homolog n=1 Tax=Candidatus Xianfuyuplasma coldseepsis TaxID=2782163 RepID=A0A7L7KT33_9MOLU|nr:Nif3-like dinuclear metal center hexameric protein [Xianfuyuplasma coldseepsis]QMS85903.1 Nif3-like dinuclear metal center hexameric protein [Xianfuyuplasma coldseepsis]
MNGNEFKSIFETYFPTESAYEWDNVGLQVGTLNKDITGIVISLDLTLEVIDEALAKNANMIVLHHPLIFKPLKTIHTETYLGQLLQKLIQHGITLYVAHTNFDVAPMGMNLYLSSMLQLHDPEPLDSINEIESLGVIGTLDKAYSLDELVAYVKQVFQLDSLRLIGGDKETYQRIAITGGSGSSVINTAISKGVDAYISGDITYHHALDAKNLGFTILDVGHNIEKHALDGLASFLKEKGIGCPIHISKVNTNPYQVK